MANRSFEMFHYRQVSSSHAYGRKRSRYSQTKLMGRLKCGEVRAIAEKNGWLGAAPFRMI